MNIARQSLPLTAKAAAAEEHVIKTQTKCYH